MKRVEGKVAVVTGGAMGIGKATAELLAAEGARVAVIDLKEEEGREVANNINQAGGTARFWKMDISKESEVKHVFDDIADKLGPINILVNNAGISGVNKPTHEIEEEEWKKVIDININGVYLCTKYAVPQMKEAGSGNIINLSSIYGMIGAANFPPYHASKGAVRLMSKNDAIQYAKDNIRVNSVHPGFIWTPMVEDVAERSDQSVEAYRKQLAELHPIGHVGEPKDIAYGILYLSSDESKFVTGSELVIDGGYTAQ